MSTKNTNSGVKHEIVTREAPPPTAGYSQAIVARGFVWVCGQVGNTPSEPGKAVSDDIGEQTRQTILNIETVLEAAGSTLADIVMVHVFVDTLMDFPAFDRVYQEMIPRPFPARVTVTGGVDPFRVEVAVTAIVPEQS